MTFVNNLPGESVDVLLQDPSTLPVEYYVTRKLNDIVITSTQDENANTLTLQTGHGVVIGNYIELYNVDDTLPKGLQKRFTQLYIVSVAGDVIRTSRRIGFATSPSTLVTSGRYSNNMNVSGTIDAPVKFSLSPPNGFKWDITRSILTMILSSAPDDGLFGNIAELTNGVFFGFEGDNLHSYLVDARVNSDFRGTAYDVSYAARSGGGGSWGLAMRKSFAGQDKYGVVIRLEGPSNDEFVAYIQDNLTGINSFNVKLMGHNVEDL